MDTQLYVGNLPWEIDDQRLREVFEAVGEVAEARVVTYSRSGRSKGYGFVTMATDELAQKAIEMFHEKSLGGRPLKIEIAQSKPQPPGGSRDDKPAEPKQEEPAATAPELPDIEMPEAPPEPPAADDAEEEEKESGGLIKKILGS